MMEPVGLLKKSAIVPEEIHRSEALSWLAYGDK